MLTFKETIKKMYESNITPNEHYTSLSKDEFLKLYHQNCSYFSSLDFENVNLIFRGFDSMEATDDFIYLNPLKRNKTPKGAPKKLVECLVSNSKTWEHIPDRFESVIGSTDENVSSLYGNLFVMIPYDDSLLCVAPKREFFTSFQKSLSKIGIENIYDFEDKFINFFNGVLNYPPDMKSCNGLISDIDSIDKYRSKIEDKLKKIKLPIFSSIYNEFLEQEKKTKITFRNFLMESFFSPNKNDFKLISINKKNFSFPPKREVWTDSECLFVRYDLFLTIKSELKVI